MSTESSTLYRMVTPGQFAPVPKEELVISKQSKASENRAITMLVAATLFVLAGLFPPWLYTLDVKFHDAEARQHQSAGYAFIFYPPPPRSSDPSDSRFEILCREFTGVRVDITRLFIGWCCIAVFAAAAWHVCGVSKAREKEPKTP